MRRLLIGKLVLVASIGVASIGASFIGTAVAKDLPVPPPQSQEIQAIRAPVPDAAIEAPPLPDQAGPRVTVKFYSTRYHDSSEGFTPGSRYRTTNTHTLLEPPGLSVSVPIQ